MSWDAFVAYGMRSSAGHTDIALGVQNLLDAKPPRIYNGYYAASDPTGYDFAGRFVYLRLTHGI
jgi:outer membrane receptor protein involved in Fe transport